MSSQLPILEHRDRILAALEAGRRLIVTAPPGTGKSTQIPQFFADRCTPQRQLVVLEPRRIAARTLACRVAEELGGSCGEEVGYQVRFERQSSDRTRILFQTYGTFLQQLLADPQALRSSIVVLDEFHERSLDADTVLAWTRRLTDTVRPDLRIMVLSATLETGVLREYLHGCPVVDVPDRTYPVEIAYQPPKPQEPVDSQVERGMAMLGGSVEGSLLVFLPGVYEIERTADRIAGACRRKGLRLLRLHGRMPLAEQQQVLRLPAQERCVILSTNVAETSLTIPGVTAVIDSGLARTASYDGERERNTLYLGRITKQNAMQRAGRAGRTAPGICLRLWGRGDETAMAEAIEPESLRLDPARHLLTLCSLQATLASDKVTGDRFRLPAGIGLLSPPPAERWGRARDELLRCGAVLPSESGIDVGEGTAVGLGELPLFRITKTGRSMSRLPVEPAVAAVLLQSGNAQERQVNTAMAALWESAPGAPGSRESRDLFAWAMEFLSTKQPLEREAVETFSQLERMLGQGGRGSARDDLPEGELRRRVAHNWMTVFSHRIAARRPGESVYSMREGRSGRLVPAKQAGGEPTLPPLILALAVHEQAGREQARKITIPLYLPIEPEWLEERFIDELHRSVDFRWDEQRRRVIAEELTTFRDVVIDRREIENAVRSHRERIAACLAEQLPRLWDWRVDDPKAVQYACRVKQTAAAYPEMNIPKLDDDDWELILHELCEGKSSLDEVRGSPIVPQIRSYIGPHLARFVEAKAPEIIMLSSGRKGRVTWFEGAPPELSARLGDLIGYPARFMLMDGRLQGVFDILAPNYRTVQKTADLGSFWKNTYPAIKRELQRKYPKHPWP